MVTKRRITLSGHISLYAGGARVLLALKPAETVGSEHLPPDLRGALALIPDHTAWPISPDAIQAEAESRWMCHMLERCNGNKSEAVRRLGIDPSTLHGRLKERS